MQRYKQPGMDLHPDGEWVRYTDHCDAMKRIAGEGAEPVAKPDMLWESDDLEDGIHGDGPYDFAENFAGANMRPGEQAEVKVLCATRVHDRRMLIKVSPDEDAQDWLSWEWLDKPLAAPAQGTQGDPSASAQAEPAAGPHAQMMEIGKTIGRLRAALWAIANTYDDNELRKKAQEAYDTPIATLAAPAPSASPAPYPEHPFAVVIDRTYEGEGPTLAVWNGENYSFSDGDCFEREADGTLDGYKAEWLTHYQLEKRLLASPAALTDEQIEAEWRRLNNEFGRPGSDRDTPLIIQFGRLMRAASPADQGEKPCGMICANAEQQGKACGVDCAREDARDAALLDWMAEAKAELRLTVREDWMLCIGGKAIRTGKTPRAAIDAAMSATPPAGE